jgi:hypothetical protein
MKKLKTLLILLTATLFFTACEKEESLENYDSISGVLTAGENVSSIDFSDIGIILAKLDDAVSLTSVSTETEEIEIIETITANADGSFSFEDLENGNYLVVISEDFSFADEEFVVAVVDGNTPNKIIRSVNRITINNKPKEYDWKITNYSNYSVSEISFFQNGDLYKTINASQINNNEFSITLDKKKDVTLIVKCLNGENLIISDPGEVFGIAARCNIFTETENGDLTVYNYWWFGKRRIKLYDFCYDCYGF